MDASFFPPRSWLGFLALATSTPALAQSPHPFPLPYPLCKEIDNEGAKEQLCVQVSPISSTREGRSYVEDSDCSVVKLQRPFRAQPAPRHGTADDPRLQDPAFMKDLNWVRDQIRSSACACCHDTKTSDSYGLWDLNDPYVWIEQFTSRGLAMMSGDLPTNLIGTYPKEENFGFDRSQTAAPSTDPARMKAFFTREIERRSLTKEQIAKLPSGNGPLDAAFAMKPVPCPDGIGVDAQGVISWGDIPLRYIYITTPEAANPIVPPNLDLPEGTIWRLDVFETAQPLTQAVAYGATPEGTHQFFPKQNPPEPLKAGQTYRLFGMRDMGRKASINCLFRAQ